VLLYIWNTFFLAKQVGQHRNTWAGVFKLLPLASLWLQARLDGLVGKPSGLIETLPKPIQRRIKYLQTLQGEYDEREQEYEKELDELDQKYEKIYGEHFHQKPARQVLASWHYQP
jgi:hypothetical protein